MDHFAGLDVSVKETSVCIVDDTGKIVREVTHRKLLQSKGPLINRLASQYRTGYSPSPTR